MLAAMRRASSRVSRVVAERHFGSTSAPGPVASRTIYQRLSLELHYLT